MLKQVDVVMLLYLATSHGGEYCAVLRLLKRTGPENIILKRESLSGGSVWHKASSGDYSGDVNSLQLEWKDKITIG